MPEELVIFLWTCLCIVAIACVGALAISWSRRRSRAAPPPPPSIATTGEGSKSSATDVQDSKTGEDNEASASTEDLPHTAELHPELTHEKRQSDAIQARQEAVDTDADTRKGSGFPEIYMDQPGQAAFDPELQNIHPPAPEPPAKELTNPRIVVIDDSKVVLIKLVKFIKSLGYEVIPGKNGLEALELIAEHGPDLLITDIEMPEMDGMELIERLNTNEKTNVMPVIAISGHDGIKEHLSRFGNVADVFKKPWDEPGLSARINELIGPSVTV